MDEIKLDGTANTEYCDCDDAKRGCWWHMPITLGVTVLAFAVGFVVGAQLAT